jgi:hypothetical protein
MADSRFLKFTLHCDSLLLFLSKVADFERRVGDQFRWSFNVSDVLCSTKISYDIQI